MTDEQEHADDLPEDPQLDADDAPLDAETEIFDGEIEGHPEYDQHQILADSLLDRMHRKAYWHSNQKQLFAFLFANCLFFASGFVAWARTTLGEGPGDPSLYPRGVDTIRGSLIFALSIYGFWTAVFNIWHAQMKIWPYLLGALLALWVGIGGIIGSIGGRQWETAIAYSDDVEKYGSKSFFDDIIMVPLSTIAPAYWLLTLGGLVVTWVIINGIMQGSQQAKAAKAEEATSGRRRRR